MRLSPEQAVEIVKSGQRVFIHTAAAAPQGLIQALTNRASELRDVEIISMHTDGPAPYAQPEYAENFHVNAMFVGANIRSNIQRGQGDYLPVFLSETPLLFRRGILPLDVALIQVSPPDRHGFCSLGVSVDVTRAAVQCARHVVAQVNSQMPRSHGDGLIHIGQVNELVELDEPLFETRYDAPGEAELAIGRHCASLIEDGATLQMGIGSIPDAVLCSLLHHQHLGVHTEMFSDGLIELVERGVVTNSAKKIHRDKIVATFVIGTRKVYDFLDDNPMVAMLDVAYVNDTSVIRRNPKVTAINSAIEVDLTGQVCADSIGTKHYSGVGGQMDFIRGASLSENGKPIIAMPSTTSKGISRIVPYLKEGAGVVTTRAHVHYVVTEYGIASLFGQNLRQRARQLIEIAHPDHREALTRAAWERLLKV